MRDTNVRVGMHHTEETVIRVNKAKLILLGFGSLAFLALGYWGISVDPAVIETGYRSKFMSPFFLHILAICPVLVGIVAGYGTIKILFGGRPALQIDSNGITGNSSFLSVGFIPWTDILGFQKYVFGNYIYIYIIVKNPEKYIPNGGLKRKILPDASKSIAPSPIAIGTSLLKIESDVLLSTLEKGLKNFKGPKEGGGI